tara:strand:+ start:460 stop:672 length:213 start_codon:yes stop_codon:yes gene_type:complete
MNTSECIGKMDLSNGIIADEVERFDCLKDCIYTFEVENVKYSQKITDHLILALFKAVKELKIEIDTLKKM